MTFIQSTISGIKTATDIAKSIMDIKNDAEINKKISEVNETLLAAQESAISTYNEYSSALQRRDEAEKEIMRIKNFEHEKERYALTPIIDGLAVVYALKESVNEGDPPHWICTNCYEDSKRSILQHRKSREGFVLIVCPRCLSEIHSSYRNIEAPKYA